MMLLGDASHGALHEKGTDDDKPYPQGTWAHQTGLLHVCDAQTGTGNGTACNHECQT